MKRVLVIFILSSFAFIFGCKRELVIPDINSSFLKYYGESGDDAAFDLKVMSDGGFVFVGYTTTNLGDKNAYIAKANQYGYIEWSNSVGGDLDDQFNDIYIEDNEIFVVGTSEDSITGKDIMLNVFNNEGDIIGEKIFSEVEDQEGNSIGLAKQSSVIIIAGSSTKASNVVLGSNAGTNPVGMKDFFILKVENKIDIENEIVFPILDKFQAGGQNNDEINSIAINAGQILASGRLNYTNQEDNIDNDNIAIINLEIDALDVPPYDGYGSEQNDVCNKIIFNSNGELILVGSINNLTDPFLLKIDDVSKLGNDNKDFISNYQDEGITVFYDVADVLETTDGDGGYIIVGSTDGEGNGGKDILLLKINANGAEEWHKTYGGDGDEVGYSVSQTGDGGYIVLATTKLGVGDDLTDQEIMLLKVSSEGELK